MLDVRHLKLKLKSHLTLKATTNKIINEALGAD